MPSTTKPLPRACTTPRVEAWLREQFRKHRGNAVVVRRELLRERAGTTDAGGRVALGFTEADATPPARTPRSRMP